MSSGSDVGIRAPVYPEGVRVDQTCGACPEQYDVFFDDRQIGYLRLRHGWFYAAWPDHMGTEVYEAEPKGDGEFYPEERAEYLERAVEALVRHDLEQRSP